VSWLEELEYDFQYKCSNGHVSCIRSTTHVEEIICFHCDEKAVYQGFLPLQLRMGTRVQKEKNGRIYYEMNDGKGNVSRISKTKLDYLEKGDTSSKITNEYKEHVQDKQIADFRKFQYNEALSRESKATVTPAGAKESLA